jgi:hypothetical protein
MSTKAMLYRLGVNKSTAAVKSEISGGFAVKRLTVEKNCT